MANFDRRFIEQVITKHMQKAPVEPEDKVVIQTLVLMIFTKLKENLGENKFTVDTVLKLLGKLSRKAQEIKKELEEEL